MVGVGFRRGAADVTEGCGTHLATIYGDPERISFWSALECPNRLGLPGGSAGIGRPAERTTGTDEERSSEAREWSLAAGGDGGPGSDALERWLHAQPSSGAGQGTSWPSAPTAGGRSAAAVRDQMIGTLQRT